MFSSVMLIVSCGTRTVPRHAQSSILSVRTYARWVHRRPARVIQPEDYDNGEIKVRHQRPPESYRNRGGQSTAGIETNEGIPSNEHEAFFNRITSYEKEVTNQRRAKGRASKIPSEKGTANGAKGSASNNGVPAFVKLGENDALFSNLMSNVKSKKLREKSGYLLLEGKRLIADSIAAGIVPCYVFFSQMNNIAGLKFPAKTEVYKIPYKTICLWSEVTTSQGIVAICKIPVSEEMEPPDDALPLTIVCDNVREPGNLGAILRTAVGVGCRQVVLTKGCVDLWDPKVLRSGAGAHFRTKILRDVEWGDLTNILDKGLVCLADNVNDTDRIDNANYAGGISKTAEDGDGTRGSDVISKTAEDGDGTHDSDATEAADVAGLKTRSSWEVEAVPVVPYHSVDYTSHTSVALVIGGETQGLSLSAYGLAVSREGVRVHIPLSSGMESLNTGIAMGIIAFEMKRQFLAKFPYEYCQDSSYAESSAS